MPKPFVAKVFTSIGKRIRNGHETVASVSIKGRAGETRGSSVDEGIKDCLTPIDGTCQKGRHSSLNGVVAVISKEGKVIDTEFMSKHCKQGQKWSKREATDEYH